MKHVQNIYQQFLQENSNETISKNSQNIMT